MIGAIGANVAGNLIAAPLLNGLNGSKPTAAPAYKRGGFDYAVPAAAGASSSPVNAVGYQLPSGEQVFVQNTGSIVNKVPSFLIPAPENKNAQELPQSVCTGCAKGNLAEGGDPRTQGGLEGTKTGAGYDWSSLVLGAALGAVLGSQYKKAAIGAVAGAVAGWAYGVKK